MISKIQTSAVSQDSTFRRCTDEEQVHNAVEVSSARTRIEAQATVRSGRARWLRRRHGAFLHCATRMLRAVLGLRAGRLGGPELRVEEGIHLGVRFARIVAL